MYETIEERCERCYYMFEEGGRKLCGCNCEESDEGELEYDDIHEIVDCHPIEVEEEDAK